MADRNEKNAGQQGKVWLVGAGPSDPGLFTIKGKQVLEEAEVVVYDALVGPSILGMIPDTAEAINVGKRSSHHTMRQEQISELLAEKAARGKRVVRLKGGDPFLFGRGGEELEVLVRERIPYEVVPGVTSAIAVPAYQGIPVTHRDFCSSVHIITGHKKEGESYNIDFEALVRTKGTLVFLMGVASLTAICEGLLAAGIAPGMPAALLSRGTTAGQERIVATVSSLPETVKLRGAKTPAIIVVGEVCRLADEFSWVDRLPLGGVKVILTRPKEQAGITAGKLRRLGAEVLELPAIRTVPRKEDPGIRSMLEHPEAYQWIVFTSPVGVRVFFERLREKKVDIRRFSGAKFAVIGTGSARELEKYGVYADLMPEIFDGAHLGEALAGACRTGDRVLIPRAAIGNRELTDALKGVAGVLVEDVAIYDTVYGGMEETERKCPADVEREETNLKCPADGEREETERKCPADGEREETERKCPADDRTEAAKTQCPKNTEATETEPQSQRKGAGAEETLHGYVHDLRNELESGTVDYVVFTSASTVKGFAALAGDMDYSSVKGICIGSQTKAAADRLGMQTWMADRASIDSLIDKLVEVHQMESGEG